MTRYSNLDEVLNHIWSALERAVDEPSHPFRHLTFGTLGAAGPNLRTIVLRDVDPSERVLLFHTDRRSKKVEELRSTNRVAFHGWDPDCRQQGRLYGSATVHGDDAVAQELWNAQPPEALVHYLRPEAPGSPLESPSGELVAPTESLSRADVAPGRRYFAVVRTVIDRMDWLHLHPEGHYRARFPFQPGREAFTGRWVVP